MICTLRSLPCVMRINLYGAFLAPKDTTKLKYRPHQSTDRCCSSSRHEDAEPPPLTTVSCTCRDSLRSLRGHPTPGHRCPGLRPDDGSVILWTGKCHLMVFTWFTLPFLYAAPLSRHHGRNCCLTPSNNRSPLDTCLFPLFV